MAEGDRQAAVGRRKLLAMNSAEFWLLISEECRLEGDDSGERSHPGLGRRLAAMRRSRLLAFERALLREITILDTAELRDVAEQLWILSDERWFCLRAWCVAGGREYCGRLGRNPGELRQAAAHAVNPFEPPTGAALLRTLAHARSPGGRAPVEA